MEGGGGGIRLRQLVFLVKKWAKVRGVNDSYKSVWGSWEEGEGGRGRHSVEAAGRGEGG